MLFCLELLSIHGNVPLQLYFEMRSFKNSKGSLYTMNMNMLMIKLVVWLGWLSCVAVGQLELSEAVTGFVNFPEVGISCIGNLAVLITSISKGRIDLELGVMDVLESIRGPKLHEINKGFGWTTCKESKDYKNAFIVMMSSRRFYCNASIVML